MFAINESIQKVLINNGIKTRPNTTTGFWLAFLLPIAINVSIARNQDIVSQQFKLATFVTFGFMLMSAVFIVQCVLYKNAKLTTVHYISALYISTLFYTCIHKGLIFSLLSGFSTTLLYYRGVLFVLKKLPMSFTFGEACLVTQAYVLFLYMFGVNLSHVMDHTPTKTSHISTLILQFGFTGITMIAGVAYKIKFFRRTLPFYILTGTVIYFWILMPLQMLLQINPLWFVLELSTGKFSTIRIVIFWCICSMFAVYAVNIQIKKNSKANSTIRKIFHVLAVAVFLPGLIDQCALLYLASGVVLGIFFALELLRVLNIPPLGESLYYGYKVFSDEKDPGLIAFTPMYLLAGIALPLWLHPDPCDMTDSAGFNLLPLTSGLLTTGIGDTLASAIGSRSGKYKWPGSQKSLEGTLACIIGQSAAVFLLIYSGYVVGDMQNIVKAGVAILSSSIVEGNTNQIDNLILPLISYICLV